MGELKPIILGDGLLGTEIQRQTNWLMISRKKNSFDISSSLDDYFLENGKPIINLIVNCIAHTDTYSKEKEPHWNVNFKFVHKLIEFCNFYNIKLVHISTDYVYTNSIKNASEEDVPVHCDNWYGYTKLLGDGIVQLLSEDYLLIRCTHKQKPFQYDKAWVDQVGNFDYVDKISEIIIKLIISNAKGLYNVGTELKTMFSLANQTGNPIPFISNDQVPKNVSMSLGKLKSLNLN